MLPTGGARAPASRPVPLPPRPVLGSRSRLDVARRRTGPEALHVRGRPLRGRASSGHRRGGRGRCSRPRSRCRDCVLRRHRAEKRAHRDCANRGRVFRHSRPPGLGGGGQGAAGERGRPGGHHRPQRGARGRPSLRAPGGAGHLRSGGLRRPLLSPSRSAGRQSRAASRAGSSRRASRPRRPGPCVGSGRRGGPTPSSGHASLCPGGADSRPGADGARSGACRARARPGGYAGGARPALARACACPGPREPIPGGGAGARAGHIPGGCVPRGTAGRPRPAATSGPTVGACWREGAGVRPRLSRLVAISAPAASPPNSRPAAAREEISPSPPGRAVSG